MAPPRGVWRRKSVGSRHRGAGFAVFLRVRSAGGALRCAEVWVAPARRGGGGWWKLRSGRQQRAEIRAAPPLRVQQPDPPMLAMPVLSGAGGLCRLLPSPGARRHMVWGAGCHRRDTSARGTAISDLLAAEESPAGGIALGTRSSWRKPLSSM